MYFFYMQLITFLNEHIITCSTDPSVHKQTFGTRVPPLTDVVRTLLGKYTEGQILKVTVNKM